MKTNLLPWKLIALGFALSMALLLYIAPEIFIHQSVRIFNTYFDFEFNFVSVSQIVQDLRTGSINLWNRFEQYPNAYLHLAGGVYSLDHILTAIVQYIHSIIDSSMSGYSYYHSTIFVFYVISQIIRTIVAYMFLKPFCGKSSTAMVLSLILLTVCLTTHMYQGFGLVFIFTLLLLVLHYLTRTIFEPSSKALGGLMASVGLVIGSSPLFFTSYFYQALHCFLMATAIVMLGSGLYRWVVQKSRPNIKQDVSLYFGKLFDNKKYLGLAFLAAIVLILPSVVMLLTQIDSYEFNAQASRFVDPFSIAKYFERSFGVAPQDQIVWRALDFYSNNWGGTWLFFGLLVVFLYFCGIFMSRNRLSLIYLITAVFFFLMNSPRPKTGFSGVFHWLNALTNPLKFAPRSFHMTGGLMMGLVVAPVVAMGVAALVGQWNRTGKKISLVGIWASLSLTGFVLYTVHGDPRVQSHLGELVPYFRYSGWAIFSLCLVLTAQTFWDLRKYFAFKTLVAAIVLAITVSEAYAYRQYFKSFFGLAEYYYGFVKRVDQPSPDLQSLNPTLETQAFVTAGKPPLPSERSYFENAVMSRDKVLNQINLGRLAYRADQYNPQHKIYQFFSGDTEAMSYVAKNPPFFMLIDPKDRDTFTLKQNPPVLQAFEHSFKLSEANAMTRGDLKIYSFALPADFPTWRNTNAFVSNPYGISLSLEGRELIQWQGLPNIKDAFEVNTYRRGMLNVSMAKDFNASGAESLQLKWGTPSMNGVTDVQVNTSDKLSVVLRTSEDAELLMHRPFDDKWRYLVDGQRAEASQARKYFVSIKVPKGEHRIDAEYWPYSPLRFLIWVQILAQFAAFYVLIWREI